MLDGLDGVLVGWSGLCTGAVSELGVWGLEYRWMMDGEVQKDNELCL